MLFDVTAVVPMLRWIDDGRGVRAHAALEELATSCDGIRWPMWEAKSISISLEALIDQVAAYDPDKPQEAGRSLLHVGFLQIQAEVEVDTTRIEEALGSPAASQTPRVAAGFIFDDVRLLIAYLNLVATIARPGAIRFAEGRILCAAADRRDDTRGYFSLMAEARNHAATVNWPPLSDLSMLTVLNWLEALPALRDGMGREPVGRAVAALSHLFQSDLSEHRDGLVWALLGLEALYAVGINGLQAQISEKSEIVLGPRTQHKKLVSRMYDFRSRLLHGDRDIPVAAFRSADRESDDVRKYEDEEYNSELIAISMLLATIQEMVRRQRHELAFSYRIAEEPSPRG